jgi:hypothetical protein
LEVLEIQQIGFKIKFKAPSKTKEKKKKLGSKVPLEIKNQTTLVKTIYPHI